MAIKILLLKDVENLGRTGDIVTARPGYIRNYLVPQGLAEVATKQALRKQVRLQEERQKQAIKDKEDSEMAASRIQEVVLSITVKVDHEGHMYGSVSVLDIAHMLKDQAGLEIERRSIQLKHPIKQTGKHKVPVKLKEGVTAEIVLEVVAEGAEEQVSKA